MVRSDREEAKDELGKISEESECGKGTPVFHITASIILFFFFYVSCGFRFVLLERILEH